MLAIGEDEALGAGEVIGEYVVDGLCGRGGYGAVVRGTHPIIGKAVAIKILDRRYSADPAAVARFVAEARAANAIRSEHIVDVFAFGTLPDGRHYHVMEYLQGSTLAEVLDQRGRLTIDEAMPLLRGVARGLAAAHARGIVHRDLKPHNVFVVDRDGQPFIKLIDFGLAKLLPSGELRGEEVTASGALMGTPEYMSPEQCRGRPVDERTDVYAFGVLAYRTLTGRLPFTGDDPLEIMIKHTGEPPALPSKACPDLGRQLDGALLQLLQKDPARRPKTVAEALALLERARADRPRSRARVALAVAAVAAALAAGGYALTSDASLAVPARAPQAPPSATAAAPDSRPPRPREAPELTPADVIPAPTATTAADAAVTPPRRRAPPPDPEDIEDPFR